MVVVVVLVVVVVVVAAAAVVVGVMVTRIQDPFKREAPPDGHTCQDDRA